MANPVVVIPGSELCLQLMAALGFTEEHSVIDVDLHFHVDETVKMTVTQHLSSSNVQRVLELLTDGSWREQTEEKNDERD